MAEHGDHALARKLLRDRARLLGVAGVVADLEPEFFAEHAAGGIDVGDRLLGAVLHLPAERRLAAGHRAGGGDDDVRRHRRAGKEAEKKRKGAEP